MADDSRKASSNVPEDLSREALNVRPENKPFTGRQWQDPKAQPYKPPENANMMAGGTEHTAGGKIPEVSLGNAVGMIKTEDFTNFYKKPCVRDALMTGIVAGAAFGALRSVLRGGVWRSCNWAVGGFSGGAVIQYNWCQYRRQAEKDGMLRAVEVLNRKEIERKARESRKEEVKAARRKAKEEEQDSQFAALKETSTKQEGSSRWWKWW